MLRPSAVLFRHFRSDPNPEAHPHLYKHRRRQTRRVFENPFQPEDTSVGSPASGIAENTKSDDEYPGDKLDQASEDGEETKNIDSPRGPQIPTWLNLFYDLVWTASFSSLTSNNEFRKPWDSVSYIVFFAIVWWMWVSQVTYCIDFYTDDWFHLGMIVLQVVIFGTLASTTPGFDVSTYIKHLPGADGLEYKDTLDMTPEEFTQIRVAKVSIQAITTVFAISRILLLIQYARVLIYAKKTLKSKSYPMRLLLVPAALAISTTLFTAAFAITLKDPEGQKNAITRYILWSVGFAIEVIAHIIWLQWDINSEIPLKAHASITERLRDITVIILGEGINALAGTFYAIQKAPGFGKIDPFRVISCIVIILSLVYLYFEGASPLKSVRRRAAWVAIHLPWQLSVILLLEGVKNQLLLLGFMDSADKLLGNLLDVMGNDKLDDNSFDRNLAPLLLEGGMSLKGVMEGLSDFLDQNATAANLTSYEQLSDNALDELYGVWYNRLSLTCIIGVFRNFLQNETISDKIWENYRNYQDNYTYALQDYLVDGPGDFGNIVWQLIEPSTVNGRYVVSLGGMALVTLATANLIHSWPRDRYQWYSIMSRYTMGLILLLLALLNIGKYQTYYLPEGVSDSQRAPVLGLMLDKKWALPALAFAYGIQVVIDTLLAWRATYLSKRGAPLAEPPIKLD